MTDNNDNGNKPKLAVTLLPTQQTRRINMAAVAVSVPSIHHLLSDAYNIIGNELARLRAKSSTEGLNDKDIESLQKLLKTAALAKAEERQAAAEALPALGKRVDELSDAELRALVGKDPTEEKP